MNKEVQEAIENLKKDFILMNNGEYAKTDDYILYNYISKIEKENKELKEQKTYWEIRATEQEQIVEGLLLREKFSKTNLEKTTREIFDKTLKDYISKDKIKAKIKELEKELQEYKDSQEWEIQQEIEMQIEILKDLLKE